MALVIPSETLEEIRFEANYETYEAVLMRIDATRFRGLGPKTRETFIRHVTTCCDGWELPYIDDVSYVMFVMTFLGSFFHEDPRYESMGKHLPVVPTNADNRISQLRTRFIAFGDRFIGKGLELYLQDLSRFRETLLPELDRHSPSRTLTLLARCHGDRSYEMSEQQFAALMQRAEVGARHLKLESQGGLRLAVVLGYWLGSGFWKDPLFPWVVEKSENGNERQLYDYAIRRLDKQLIRPQENLERS